MSLAIRSSSFVGMVHSFTCEPASLKTPSRPLTSSAFFTSSTPTFSHHSSLQMRERMMGEFSPIPPEKTTAVDEAQWSAIRGRLREIAQRWGQALSAPRQVERAELNGLSSLVLQFETQNEPAILQEPRACDLQWDIRRKSRREISCG